MLKDIELIASKSRENVEENFSSELTSRNNAEETIKPASVAGNELTRKY